MQIFVRFPNINKSCWYYDSLKTTFSDFTSQDKVYIDMLRFLHKPKKDNNQIKNKKQLGLPENRTVWKSNNKGVKEETFIQTSRKGRAGQQGGEDVQQAGGYGPSGRGSR